MRITTIMSEYLKAADLMGREASVVISQVKFEKMDGKDRAVLFFIGKSKGLMLNKTNINNIVYLYGEETNDWNGKEVVLYPVMVDYQGKSVEAIRVKGPQHRAQPAQHRPDPISSGPVAQPIAAPAGHPINDDIPF